MPNHEEETRKDVVERAVTKVHGQPTNQDLDLLEDELLRIASSIYSELGGGAHGHAGLLLSDVDYAAMAPGTPFVIPPNPGLYPAGPIPAAQRPQREAEHNGLIKQFQTCIGVAKGLKELILQAIEEDFVLELRVEQTGYLNVTPLQMMTHLRARWASADLTSSIVDMGESWILRRHTFLRRDFQQGILAHGVPREMSVMKTRPSSSRRVMPAVG